MDVAHKHVLVLKFTSAKTMFFGIMMPLVLYYLFPQGWWVWISWMGIGVLGLFYHFIDWYFDAWLLTNMGIIDVQRDGFFDFTSTRVDYHMIEGISYSVNGMLRTMFGFGDITVDKLGTKTSVVLHDAANPKKLERQVMRYQELYVSERSLRDHDALKGMLADMIAYHVQNNKIDPKR